MRGTGGPVRRRVPVPPGYYDRVMASGHPVQRAWHRQKFSRVREMLATDPHGRLLDVGCGPGSFLGLGGAATGSLSVGIDTDPAQISYATGAYGSENRHFVPVGPRFEWPFPDGAFDAAAIIEVLEHLDRAKAVALLGECARVLRPGAPLVITTPNYASHWPILEQFVSRLGEVDYGEQHVTRFLYPLFRRQIGPLVGDRFRFEYSTTILFLAPFLALFSSRLSDRTAHALPPRRWHWPFGALIIARLRRQP